MILAMARAANRSSASCGTDGRDSRPIILALAWLFHRKGKPIKTFRRAWLTALLKAGYAELVSEKPRVIKPLRVPHDFRRTAIRNLERAGVPRSVAMKLVGHKTESIYRRYAIVSESDLREAVETFGAVIGNKT